MDQRTKFQQKPKRPVLSDVAREAGVGTTTVSRVINGGHYVDAATMAKVQAVIGRLGYQPSFAARALKGERSHSIGLIVPTLLDPFFAKMASIVQEATRQRNYILIVLASEDDAAQEIQELDVFRSYRVDGILAAPPRQQTRKFLTALSSLSVPVVALDRPLEGRYCSVVCDNFAASRHAVEHLIQHGRRSILCFGGDPNLYTIKERVRGYEEAVRSAGFEPCVVNTPDPEQMPQVLRDQFADPARRPDAIYALYSAASVSAYEFIIDSPYTMPVDVALLGFDDFPLAGTLRPAISTVRQNVSDLGFAAANLVFDQIKSEFAPRQITISADLIPRSSCGCDSHTRNLNHSSREVFS